MKVSNKIPNSMQNTPEAAKAGKTASAEAMLGAKKSKTSSVGEADIAQSARVDLSSRAQDIKKAKELATAGESIDEAKVARLQALIDSGKYKVDAEAIADRLLDEHMKMPL